MAYLTYPDISYSQFNPRYTGFEIGAAGAEGVVRSCGMRARTSGVRSGAIKGALKNIKRRIFRTGGTKAQIRKKFWAT